MSALWNFFNLLPFVLLLFVVALAAVAWYRRRSYVGMGWWIGYHGDNPELPHGVYVLSRLLHSPAHKAGVKKFDELVEYDGCPMDDFIEPGAMERFFKAHLADLRLGDKVVCTLRRGGEELTVTLEAALIRGKVPLHLPQARPHPDDHDYHDYHYGMAHCTRTGEWVPTMSVSDARVNKLLGAR